jgi:hypothetical protein
MTSRRDGRQAAAPASADAPDPASRRQAALASRPSPALPPGAGRVLGNRVLVYLRPAKIEAALPQVSTSWSGMILAGQGAHQSLRDLRDNDVQFPVLVDPAAYEKVTATCEAPFSLPGAGDLAATLEDLLDAQIRAGAAAALSPTGFIPAAGTDVLKAAARQFSRLRRTDSIFVAPLDVSLLGKAYFPQTAAILASVGHPVALVLGGQGDPLTHSSHIIPNLRALAASVPLIAMRTDFNGLDLVAHGAISAAIGTGGSTRHTVDPTERRMSFNSRDESPSVLVPELASWFKGSKIAELFGARPSLAPRCSCSVCGRQRLTRFLRKEHQDEAIAHAIAVWTIWVGDLTGLATMRDRAQYWKNLCTGAVAHHAVFLKQLQRLDGLKPQISLQRWSALPAWITDVPAPVS